MLPPIFFIRSHLPRRYRCSLLTLRTLAAATSQVMALLAGSVATIIVAVMAAGGLSDAHVDYSTWPVGPTVLKCAPLLQAQLSTLAVC